MLEAIYRFPVAGTPANCEEIKSGHINRTYLVTTDSGDKYILQWVNRFVFPNVSIIMDNVAAIRDYFQTTGEGNGTMITYMDTIDGSNCYYDNQGGCWRMYRFVDNSVAFNGPVTIEAFYESARAFGAFQYALRDFPVYELKDTIENFHNTPWRFAQLRTAIADNAAGRVNGVYKEIEYAFSCEERASTIQKMADEGRLPVRVTHNDTKLNNVLFDADTMRAICVIDLDTVMPGLSVFDFGDAIRFGASTADEDERDLSKVALSTAHFRAFTKGFLEACPSLTESEISTLPLGAFTMTLECGIRFLADYLNGDKYFSTDYPEHNLVRARNQFKLAADILASMDELETIVVQERNAL